MDAWGAPQWDLLAHPFRMSSRSSRLTLGLPRSTCSTVALTAGSDTPTANDRRLIAQRRADDVHSGSRRDLDELRLVRTGQFPFNDALEEGLEFSGCHGHLEPNRIVAIGAPGVGHNLG